MSSAAKTVKAPAQTFGISGRYASALWQHANKVGALEKVGPLEKAVFLYCKARGLVLRCLGLFLRGKTVRKSKKLSVPSSSGSGGDKSRCGVRGCTTRTRAVCSLDRDETSSVFYLSAA